MGTTRPERQGGPPTVTASAPPCLARRPGWAYGADMSRDRARVRADAIENVRHSLEGRVRAHSTALRAAEALGWPSILGPAVADTEARLDECRACLALVRDAEALADALAEGGP